MAAEIQQKKLGREDKEIGSSHFDKLRVLTLNCWGIPFISKFRKERFDAIAHELSKANYDIVSLQEVWDIKDYETLKIVLKTVFPYSYYFYGGVIGTGICIFSRYPILNTFVYPFALSGYAYALSHGDWFGGKAACFALIDHPRMKIHFFTSHLHAEYSRTNDFYLTHRAVQAYHLAKLINQFTDPEDFVILCGDMNSQPIDPCYRILQELPQLRDCWGECGLKDGFPGNTSDRSENAFTSVKYDREQIGGPEDGKRIDYVFYRSLNQRWQCDNAYVTMRHVPGRSFPYSDHDAVAASFAFKGKSVMPELDEEEEKSACVLTEIKDLMKKELKRMDKHYYKKFLVLILLLTFVFWPVVQPAVSGSLFDIHGAVGKLAYVFRVFLTIFACGFAWFLVINRRYERHVYESVSMEVDLELEHGHTSCKR